MSTMINPGQTNKASISEDRPSHSVELHQLKSVIEEEKAKNHKMEKQLEDMKWKVMKLNRRLQDNSRAKEQERRVRKGTGGEGGGGLW